MAGGSATQKFKISASATSARVCSRPRKSIAASRTDRLPLAGIALAFVRSRFFTASTIIGATTTAQLDELAQWFDAALPPQVLSDLEAVNGTTPSPAAQ